MKTAIQCKTILVTLMVFDYDNKKNNFLLQSES